MKTECKTLIDSYVAWLRDRISVEELDGACQITTPFLDRHNDRLQIFAVPNDGGFRLTDDGYTIGDLQASGCTLDTPNRKQHLHTILNGFGVHEDSDELWVEASAATFPQKKHVLVQAMLAVNDMFISSKHRVATLFLEDISSFLDSHDVRYSPNVEFTGKTGFVHKFDFIIPKSRRSPERLLRAINNPSKDSATSALFAWTDTKDVRSPHSQFLVVLNDSDKQPSLDLQSAFQGYGASVILWSERDRHISELAA